MATRQSHGTGETAIVPRWQAAPEADSGDDDRHGRDLPAPADAVRLEVTPQLAR